MKFQYDVTEYSTSIKPFAFKNYMDKYSKVIYFDPDIMCFSHLNELDDDAIAFVTPHVSRMENTDNVLEEANILNHGVFNCGFIAFRSCSKSMTFIDWWANRLIDYCYDDLTLGIYTDQKWVDYIPVFLGNQLKIISNCGYNYAPWNYCSNEVIIKNNNYFLKPRQKEGELVKLCFAHFSGFNYQKLIQGETEHSFRNIYSYHDIEPLLLCYGKNLKEHNSLSFINNPYKYNFYSNGKLISKLNRRLYRTIKEKKRIKEPFNSKKMFYGIMSKNKLLSDIPDAKKKNTAGVNNKERFIYLFFKCIKKILGIKKYTEFLRAMQIYSTYGKQDFLISNNYKKK